MHKTVQKSGIAQQNNLLKHFAIDVDNFLCRMHGIKKDYYDDALMALLFLFANNKEICVE